MLSRVSDHRPGVLIVRRLWAALSLVALLAALGLASGCVDSSEEDAQTPATAPTVENSAIQTDSEGNFVTAPPSGAGQGPGEVERGGGAAAGGAAVAGDAAAGKTFFAATCTSCHVNDGLDAGGVGPQLAGMGLDPEAVRNQVVNGGGAMPAGLASGADLDNVVAYVESIQ
jgi:mono/diheme cytochrome c family protein